MNSACGSRFPVWRLTSRARPRASIPSRIAMRPHSCPAPPLRHASSTSRAVLPLGRPTSPCQALAARRRLAHDVSRHLASPRRRLEARGQPSASSARASADLTSSLAVLRVGVVAVGRTDEALVEGLAACAAHLAVRHHRERRHGREGSDSHHREHSRALFHLCEANLGRLADAWLGDGEVDEGCGVGAALDAALGEECHRRLVGVLARRGHLGGTRVGHVAGEPALVVRLDERPARLELRAEVPEEPSVAGVEGVEVLHRQRRHVLVLELAPLHANRALAELRPAHAGAVRAGQRQLLVEGRAGLVVAHVRLAAVVHAAGDLGVARQVVVEAVEPHRAVVRRKRPLPYDERHVDEVLHDAHAALEVARVLVVRADEPGAVPRLVDVRVHRLVRATLHEVPPRRRVATERVMHHEHPIGRTLTHEMVRVPVVLLERLEGDLLPGLVDGLEAPHGRVLLVRLDHLADHLDRLLDVRVVDARVAAAREVKLAHPVRRADGPVLERGDAVGVLGGHGGPLDRQPLP
mmetsp:Transcript_42736/g.112469  ORF Transcript_42736/g.112469 Transcript_42736/m.112469 type:complete len:523 (+) Transcript_42736:219-1787(+)